MPATRLGVAVLVAVCLLSTVGRADDELFATTNRGELLRINLDTGMVTEVGQQSERWSDIARDPLTGRLYAVSNQSSATPHTLFEIDPTNGAVVRLIGDLNRPYVSDITFAADGTLYGSWWDGWTDQKGQLIRIDPEDASVYVYAPFGGTPVLQNGGIAQDPQTGKLHAVESGYAVYLSGVSHTFTVDSVTGSASSLPVPLGLGGQLAGRGFDSLLILPDGRTFGTEGGDTATGNGALYALSRTPDPTTGLLETTLVPLTFDASISGKINGLAPTTTFRRDPVAALDRLALSVFDLNIANGISNALDSKLDNALDALFDTVDGNDDAAINMLQAFINAVSAQAGNKIPESDADALIADALAIIDALEGG